MIHELSFSGVFFSSGIATAIAALVATFAISRVLIWLGIYRRLWHPALVDACLFVILWAAAVTLPAAG